MSSRRHREVEVPEYFVSIPNESQSLRRRADNLESIDAIKDFVNPTAIGLWLAMIWLKYEELFPEVRE